MLSKNLRNSVQADILQNIITVLKMLDSCFNLLEHISLYFYMPTHYVEC